MGKYILMVLVFFIGLFIICSLVGLIMAVPALATFIYQRCLRKQISPFTDEKRKGES